MTTTQAQLVEHIKRALASGTWRRVQTDLPNVVHLIYTETCDTPEFAKRVGRYAPSWESPTYDRMVGITVWPGKVNPLLRVSLAPWMGSNDSHVSNTRAVDILANPSLVWNGRGAA